MKIIILSVMLLAGLASCKGTGDRTYQSEETTDHGVTPQRHDSTSTSSQSTYHTDSITGQGSAYDTSNTNNQGGKP